MRVSAHFNRSEFACKCGCGFDTVDAQTLEILEAVREHFKQAVIITSAARCEAHNAAVGGVKNSLHTQGRACDISVRNHSPDVVASFVDSIMPARGGVGTYPDNNFVHIDTRSGNPARWRG